MKQPNPFVPRKVYEIRRKHYVFWEISRLARGLPKTFTYTTWDAKAVSQTDHYVLVISDRKLSIIANDVPR